MKKYLSVTDNRLFSRAYSKGVTHANKLTALYVLPSARSKSCADGGCCNFYLGITVNRKLGKAHSRNRVKRLIREVIRKERPLLKDGLTVIVAARSAVFQKDVKADDVYQQMKYSFRALDLYKEKPYNNTKINKNYD